MRPKLFYPFFFFLPKVIPGLTMLIVNAKRLSEELHFWSQKLRILHGEWFQFTLKAHLPSR